MTIRLPLLPLSGQEGGTVLHATGNKISRLLICCPVSDVFSGVGNSRASAHLLLDPGVSRSICDQRVSM